MRRLIRYIHQLPDWPQFKWDHEKLAKPLVDLRHRQGKLMGRMENLGFTLRSEAMLQTLTLDVLKSSEIEGEILNPDQVRSSVARRLGMDIAGLIPADRHVEGVVEMMVDATQRYAAPLTDERLFNWHAALFPTARNGMQKIIVGAWRTNTTDDPMQVISGAMGKEKIHFEAPASTILAKEMKSFLHWFNTTTDTDPVIKAAIAHLWFVTIHPFDDGNGRIARAITDMQLSRADGNAQRFYSMSAQIRKERNAYYETLEMTQKGNLDITTWIQWFLTCLERATTEVDQTLGAVLYKARFWEQNNTTVLNERQKEMLNKLLNQFEGKLTTSKWAKMTKCSQDSALRDIQDLVGKGVLVKEESGGRSTSYVLKK
jgi:Fic family protein